MGISTMAASWALKLWEGGIIDAGRGRGGRGGGVTHDYDCRRRDDGRSRVKDGLGDRGEKMTLILVGTPRCTFQSNGEGRIRC
jgi:hypothetical protein